MNFEFKNQFRENILTKKLQLGLWLSTTSSYVAEIAATIGYDWLLIDAEHSPNTAQDIRAQLQAVAPYASHPIVRPIEGTQSNVKQLLDLGAQSLLIPMVDSVEQAKNIINYTQYPPTGNRGVGSGVARAARWGKINDYMSLADKNTCILLQIETVDAVRNLDEMLELDRVDGFFVGPADLSASLGHPNDFFHPEVQKTLKSCFDKINNAGKAGGFLATDATLASKSIEEWGATFVAVGVDTMLYTSALSSNLNQFKKYL